ncbi:MAG: hypothetical protein MAG451_02995 [Anaerolineales bacterium]|nr:hypothetical protein [Anaerolineales bacterium]
MTQKNSEAAGIRQLDKRALAEWLKEKGLDTQQQSELSRRELLEMAEKLARTEASQNGRTTKTKKWVLLH